MILSLEELARVITARDALEHQFCVRGQRRIWNASPDLTRGVTYEQFVKEGVTVWWLLETGNPYAAALVRRVLGKDSNGQQEQ